MQSGGRSTLLVQGWTGINHSYAMVNQYQLLELAQDPSLALYTEQMPLYDSRWTASKNHSGFGAAQQQVLDGIAPWAGQPVSAIYRIHMPNQLELAAAPTMTFVVTELGLDRNTFASPAAVQAYQDAGHLVVTPSRWSRERILSAGLRPESVLVIPHGVDSSKFSPFSAEERRQARQALGYSDEDVVFLNVGAPFWNKGMDLMLEAFFALRQSASAGSQRARLLIKDQQALYGLSAVQMIRDLSARGTLRIDDDSVASIRVLPQTLSLEQLRGLYNVADYYLSPYRAEGFNLPVIDAIACGTPVIVTAGGATDDFCDEHTAIRVPSTLHRSETVGPLEVDAYLQPDMAALVEILRTCCAGGGRPAQFAFGRASLLAQYSWQRAARMIRALVPA